MRSGYMDFHPTETAEPSCSASKKFRIRAQKTPSVVSGVCFPRKSREIPRAKKGGYQGAGRRLQVCHQPGPDLKGRLAPLGGPFIWCGGKPDNHIGGALLTSEVFWQILVGRSINKIGPQPHRSESEEACGHYHPALPACREEQ
jgi:hypothetical protein